MSKFKYAVYVKVGNQWRAHGEAARVSTHEAYGIMDEVFNCSGIKYIDKATGLCAECIEY